MSNDTLAQLRDGKLAGATRLKLSCGLTTFPREIFDLADTLEVLDLGGNHLTELPDDLARLHHLKILFCTDNDFRHVPAVVGACPSLTMVAFKSNQVVSIDPDALSLSLRWLILTGNQIRRLPGSIGRCSQLQKLMLAGNRLQELPDEMAECRSLELLRLSANEFTRLPEWLLAMPNLCWLAMAGNPCTEMRLPVPDLPSFDWAGLCVGERLGEGASGVISRAVWNGAAGAIPQPVAIKIFKGAMTSDGLPACELAACMAAGRHPNLIGALGRITNHPAQSDGLVMSLIDPEFKTLAGPPSMQSCTRDVYPESLTVEVPALLQLVKAVALAAQHLHSRQILHGDLYAHNIQWLPTGQALLGDFGAAAWYGGFDTASQRALERLEVRAWGILVEELLARVEKGSTAAPALDVLSGLQQRCCAPVVGGRPTFAEVVEELEQIVL